MQSPSITTIFDLHGKTAIVTGGAMGIGQAIATRLAEAGAAVMITDIALDGAEQTAAGIRDNGGKAQAIRADAGSVADATAVVEATVQAFGSVDCLVNNAGIFPFSPALETTEALWDKVLDINLKGPFFYAQAVARQMIAAQHGGTIINIASIDALHPTGHLAHYDASKGGMVMLTKALAQEFGAYQIRVNAIAPGGIATPGAAALNPAATTMTSEQRDALTQAFLARIPLGRMGVPNDIANVALFLASEAASYLTGSLLVVDGGYLLS
jgi:2-deoxy-D-gluconate 3-dehydrogenase